MTTIDDPGVRALFDGRHHAVLSTLGADGTIHSTVVWIDLIDGRPAVNSAVGRRWPSDLERNPNVTVVVYDEHNPYDYVEIRGTATARPEGSEEHIDALARKYLHGVDAYPWRNDAEKRITYVIEPTRVRHQKQR
ncbi:hypothetical protein NUM3379_14850 [Kineococcus sp. NUM-3379]